MPNDLLCPSETLARATAMLAENSMIGLREVERLTTVYDRDPRLHFLLGSLFAADRRYDEAAAAMRQSIVLAPDFDIARFQLGVLELSSGRPDAAELTWESLQELETRHPLRLFAGGLCCLSRDDFDGALRLLQEGIAVNSEWAPVNGDMQKVIDEILARSQAPSPDEPTSATQLLLQQFQRKPTQH